MILRKHVYSRVIYENSLNISVYDVYRRWTDRERDGYYESNFKILVHNYQCHYTSSDQWKARSSYRQTSWYHITLLSGQHSNTCGPQADTNVSIRKVPVSNNTLNIIRQYSTQSDLMNCTVHKMNPHIQFMCELHVTVKLYIAACSLSDVDSHFLNIRRYPVR